MESKWGPSIRSSRQVEGELADSVELELALALALELELELEVSVALEVALESLTSAPSKYRRAQ